MRDLRERQSALDRRLTELDRDVADLRERAAALDDRMGRQRLEIDVLADQSADLRGRIGQRRQRREGLHAEVEGSREEISGLEQEIRELDESWNRARGEAARAEGQVQALQARLEKAEREIREGDDTASAAPAGGDGGEGGAGAAGRAPDGPPRQARPTGGGPAAARGRALQMAGRLEGARARRDENERSLLETSASLATWYMHKEEAERRLAERAGERDRLRGEKGRRADEAQANRGGWRERQEQAHARELEVNDLRHRRDALCDRLREDYQLELAELYGQGGGAAIAFRLWRSGPRRKRSPSCAAS